MRPSDAFPARFRHASLRAGLLLALSLAAGCGGGGGGSTSSSLVSGTGPLIAQPNTDTLSLNIPTGQSAAAWSVVNATKALAQKPWTFLVYLNGANDLGLGVGDFDLLNVHQMEQVGSSSSVNIVVQWEAQSGDDLYGDRSNAAWSGTRRYYITQNASDTSANISSLLISSNSTVDMGDWQALHDFVQWGVQAFPAQHYCLVIWDHGAGWRAATLKSATSRAMGTRLAASRSAVPTSRGVSFNYFTGSVISTDQLPEAINIGNLSGQRFDIVSFDASLMQMAEVAYELSNPGLAAPTSYVAPAYIQGSEESPPGSGLPYNTLLQDLANNPSQSALAFASDICDETLHAYGTASDSTQSVIDTSKMAALITALNGLGSALTNAQTTWGPQIAMAQNNAEAYALGDGEEAGADYWYWDYHDLVDFVTLLSNSSNAATFVNDPGVLSACQSVKTAAVGNAIAYNRHGSSHANSNGLTIWIPSPTDFTLAENEQAGIATGHPSGPSDQLYTGLSIATAAPSWLTFLNSGPSTYTPYNYPSSYGSQ